MRLHRGTKIALTIVLLLVLIIAFWAVMQHFNPPPLQKVTDVNAALKQARADGASQYASERYKQAEKLLRLAEQEMTRQGGNVHPFRSYKAADSLLILAEEAALAAAADARASFDGLKAAALRSVENLRQDLESWRKKSNNGLVNWEAERLISSAQMSSDLSRRLWDKGEYQAAIDQADKGQEAIAKLAHRIDHYNADEQGNYAQWNGWVNQAIAYSRNSKTASIVVDKAAHKLFLFLNGKKSHVYDCDLGYNSARQKLVAGDGATPEGQYSITQVRPRGSKYYKALLLNYPNERDKKRFRENKASGLIESHKSIGGLIEIHGHGGQNKDWTEGCIALSNADMDHLMKYVRVATPVTIVRRSELRP